MRSSIRFGPQYAFRDPTLTRLIRLGFTYLTPRQALAARQGKTGNVLLEDILREQLDRINRVPYRGAEYPFTENNIRFAIEQLKGIRSEGLLRTNELVYEKLTLGLSLEQSFGGYTGSFSLRYIDWKDWTKNVFHVTTRFPVTGSGDGGTLFPDIVLFVNGIPFVVIQCASPGTPIGQVIAESIRNQQNSYSSSASGQVLFSEDSPASDTPDPGDSSPNIFSCVQFVLATNGTALCYGAVGAPPRFWSTWRESAGKTGIKEAPAGIRDKAGSSPLPAHPGKNPDRSKPPKEESGEKAIQGLCRPKRLLELVYRFSVFDNGVRKMARYPQYFAIRRILPRIRTLDTNGRRRGGIVWHTQGSGKSLTMVMLARSLAEEPGMTNPRIVLVTDRRDLDEQIKDTFAACDMAPQRARTGRDLLELVSRKKAGIITTLVHKFDKALNIRAYRDDSIDIFMLIDESHRTQFGAFATRMRQMFPNACYLGFTGTPLMQKEKNNFEKFGGLIHRYTISQAIRDKAIVPLLYEGRHVEMRPDEAALDAWFEEHTRGLSETEKAAWKKKHARSGWLNRAGGVIYARALDISRHFRTHYRGSGLKGQLVAPSRAAALAYHRHLTDIGLVSSAVIISSPNGNGSIRRETAEIESPTRHHPGEMGIKQHGSREEYNKRLINRFKHTDDPEILIVVDKLQTGFDAPCNAVLYLTRPLRGHALLQTIARVNRIHEDNRGHAKAFGLIVDYAGILGEFDKALTRYSAFDGFDDEDLDLVLVSRQKALDNLPRQHAALRELFLNPLGQLRSDEEITRHLSRDEMLRAVFRERLSEFGRTLDIALANDTFLADTLSGEWHRYRSDYQRFQKLKTTIGHSDQEPRIEKMPSICIRAQEAIQLTNPIHLLPTHTFYGGPLDEMVGTTSWDMPYEPPTLAAQANVIATLTRRTLAEHQELDPAFYDKFSKLIEQVMDDFKARRLSDIEYLRRMTKIRHWVGERKPSDVPVSLKGNENAIALYRVLKPYFAIPVLEAINDTSTHAIRSHDITAASEAAITIDNIFRRHWKVRFWDDEDTVKQVMNDIDDYLYDEVRETRGIELSTSRMDEIIDKVMATARNRNTGCGK
uniref:Type I restriction enzyme endonuclease subunit n=1 Tax=Candidatus Kentrum sp. DK TaxID=2126562 RepID=A0A450RZ17_9GAMM|nr:MAG: type I restriction enzyme, R subunit [Candidatus Kentron sp. DK]